MPYIIAALVAALALTGWGLKSAWESKAVVEQQLEKAEADLRDADVRQKAIDDTVGKLISNNRVNAKKLDETLTAIRSIKPEPGDTNESIDCLTRPVPAALSRSLRDDANAKRDRP